jgi:hypothetical protein
MENAQPLLLQLGHPIYLIPLTLLVTIAAKPIWILLQNLFEIATEDLLDNATWTPVQTLSPLLSFLVAWLYCLCLLAYPPSSSLRRKLSTALLAVPLLFALKNGLKSAPMIVVCDTFMRFLYIWFAAMSNEITILEFSPNLKEGGDTFKNRMKQAYAVIFNRSRTQPGSKVLKHSYSRKEFVLRHTWKAIYLVFARAAWHLFTLHYFPHRSILGLGCASFFRRLPQSFNAAELVDRIELTFPWCIDNLFMYEIWHSFFAIFFVGLRIDQPGEWSMALMGSVKEAWSVRRYWSKHWHNYVYFSFSAHAKIVTREWMGLQRGHLSTRLVENTLVFGMSGLAHSMVRFAQNPTDGGHWLITYWYVGQMVPIVLEGAVQHAVLMERRQWLGERYPRVLVCLERAVGYVWVVGWMMWSIPKYVHMKHAVIDAKWREERGMPVRDLGEGHCVVEQWNFD